MRYKASTLRIIEKLKELYPEGLCSLQYEKDYELLFAVRLSAQCTDARVNLVTPALFTRFPTLEAFAAADPREVGEYIHSCGFYQGSGGLRPAAFGAVRRKGSRQYGGSHLPPRRGTENRQSDFGGRVRPALLCVRHPLYPHHRAAGHHRRVQGPGEGGAAASQGHPPGGIRAFLPPDGAFRPGCVHRPLPQMRGLPLKSGLRSGEKAEMM